MSTVTQFTKERWKQFWKFYSDLPHQNKALDMLYDRIFKSDKSILTEEEKWRIEFSNNSTTPQPPVLIKQNPLIVPYQLQHDNASGKGYRECFDSSCAMVAMYYKKVKNDDEYSKIRAKFGDTIHAETQVKTLRYLNLKAEFKTSGTTEDLERLINNGQPVPVGWLHHGHVTSPRGGGHWSVVIGFDSNRWIHNDPNGEADMVNGGYVNRTNGKTIKYTRLNWDRRWRVNGTGGWYLNVSN